MKLIGSNGVALALALTSLSGPGCGGDDAPDPCKPENHCHYDDAGAHPADLSLEKYIGPAHVATISRRQGGIVPGDFDGHNLAGMERLLIHTWVSDLPDDRWAEDFPYPTIELVDWLAGQGVALLGVDTPSVDRHDDDQLVCHHRLYQHGIVNLETLTLAGVPDGLYELVALPLKIAGVCGSPVRAILRGFDI